MSRVITFSRNFPKGHARAGEPTYFMEKIWKSLLERGQPMISGIGNNDLSYDYFNNHQQELQTKKHTIRRGHRWKAGDVFSPRVWSGVPYRSRQIIIAPDIKIVRADKIQILSTGEININVQAFFYINGRLFDFLDGKRENIYLTDLAKNDGLSREDFISWFGIGLAKQKTFSGQIIIWDDTDLIY